MAHLRHNFSRINRVRKSHHVSEAEGFNGWPTVCMVVLALVICLLGMVGVCREFF